jgi:glutathione S-transferase
LIIGCFLIWFIPLARQKRLGANPSLADINLMPFAARLDYLGLLDLWIKDRPRVKGWWALAREWPSFKSGLRDLISGAEFSEMKTWSKDCK